MKCPCEECITYAICHNTHSIKRLVDKCSIVAKYITSKEKAIIVIKAIGPKWYINPSDGEPKLLEGAVNIYNHAQDSFHYNEWMEK
jgi:hypothetical protein